MIIWLIHEGPYNCTLIMQMHVDLPALSILYFLMMICSMKHAVQILVQEKQGTEACVAPI